MAYRIQVNGVQIFGNGEAPKAFLDFLREQGVDIDKDCCFEHIFEIGTLDVMKAVDAIEQAVKDIDEERRERLRKSSLRTINSMAARSLWDFSDKEEYLKTAEEGDLGVNITDLAFEVYTTGYIFIPVKFVKTLLHDGCIKTVEPYTDGKHLHCYTQTDKIEIKGY